MGRPRTLNAKIKDLPRGFRKVGTYWHWRPTDAATRAIWEKLQAAGIKSRAGATPNEAGAWWDKHVAPRLRAQTPDDEIAGTVEELLRLYEGDELPSFKRAETVAEYEGRIRRLRAAFGPATYPKTEAQALQHGVLRDATVQQHLHANRDRASSANKDIQLLSRIFRLARTRWGCTAYNPCEAIEYLPEHPRDVYVDDKTFTTIAGAANPQLQCMLDISSQTAARIGSVYTLRLSQITDTGLTIRVGKKKNGKGYIEKSYTWTPDLRAAVDRALALRAEAPATADKADPAGPLFLTAAGRPYSQEAYKSAWARARKKLGLKAREVTVHDLGRAKAISDAESDQAGQQLAGHEDAKITRRVYRRKQEAVTPLPAVKTGGR